MHGRVTRLGELSFFSFFFLFRLEKPIPHFRHPIKTVPTPSSICNSYHCIRHRRRRRSIYLHWNKRWGFFLFICVVCLFCLFCTSTLLYLYACTIIKNTWCMRRGMRNSIICMWSRVLTIINILTVIWYGIMIWYDMVWYGKTWPLTRSCFTLPPTHNIP